MKSLLESTLNTRELGGLRCDGGITRTDSVLRSDRICSPTDRDIEYLLSRGINTVIDMRTPNDIASEPAGLDREGFRFRHIPIAEGGYVPERAEDVVPSYMAIAHTGNITDVFRTIARAPGGVIFNCWAGKDRTGVVSAILLMFCGVSDEDVIVNYTLTAPYSEELWKLMRKFRTPEEMKIVLPGREYMEGFIREFRREYGSAGIYLKSIGLSEDELQSIREKLIRK